jgi:Flp pilus assembly protein TadD
LKAQNFAGPKGPLLAATALAVAAVGVYANSFRVPFLFDDPLSTVDNPTIRRWSTALFPPHGQGITVEGRPMLNLSLALNWHLSGPAVWSYHLVNLIIHIAAAWTLLGILRRTLSLACVRASADSSALAFVIALLWTVHPLQTESVTYVVERAESLMAFFYLLTLYSFIRYAASSSPSKEARLWGGLALASCLAGVATKEVMVSAPVMVFLYDRTFLSGTFRDAWRRHWRMHIAFAASWILLIVLVAGAGARGGTAGLGIGVTPLAYFVSQFHAIARYLWQCFWPYPLVFDYGPQWVHGAAGVIPYALIVVPLAALTAVGFWRWPAAAFLGAWFFAILSPTSSIIPLIRQTSAEHRMYLPLAAVLTFAVCGGYGLISDRKSRYIACIGALAIPLAVASVRRNRDYFSEETLYRDSVEKSPDNAFTRYNLGTLLDDAGHPDEAIPQYEAAIRLDPGMICAYLNLGNSYRHLDRLVEAEATYREALRVDPNYANARYELGLLYLKLDRKEQAQEQFNAAVLLNPKFAEARDNLGGLYLDAGRLAEAREQFEAVLQLGSASVETHYNLAIVFLLQHRPAQAREQLEAALSQDPSFVPARERLHELDAQAGR